MSKKFQYNFTNENELFELRDRIKQLQEENSILKQSLEQLIKVNTELTESIEQFNTDNLQQEMQNQQMEEMHNTIEMLNNQIQNLKKQLEYNNHERSKTSKKMQNSAMEEKEVESLVNVLQELIESFKNMQTRYQSEMLQFQKNFEDYKRNYEFALNKLEQQYKQKLNTLEPIILQLHRKDENMSYIEEKIYQLQNKKEQNKQNHVAAANNHKQTQQLQKLEHELQEKNKAIRIYQTVIERLKAKFNEKM